VGILIGAIGRHWQLQGAPAPLIRARLDFYAYLSAFRGVWKQDVLAPLSEQYATIVPVLTRWHDALAVWMTARSLPQPRPVPVAADPADAPTVRIQIGAGNRQKSLLLPVVTSHRFIKGVSAESFQEWRLRTWAEQLHATAAGLAHDKRNRVTGVEVLYGNLTLSGENIPSRWNLASTREWAAL
jgi:hypothetical protein